MFRRNAERGEIWADKRRAGSNEKFQLIQLSDGQVALKGSIGYLATKKRGGRAVYAKSNDLGPLERWTLISNADGTVSLRADGSDHLLYAMSGSASLCDAIRPDIASDEKFHTVRHDDGTVSLKTAKKGLFVSVHSSVSSRDPVN